MKIVLGLRCLSSPPILANILLLVQPRYCLHMRKHLSEMGIHMIEESLFINVLLQDQCLPAHIQ